MTSKGDVIARYGNFYRGDDDLFTHCLILRDGQCWLLGQGLRPVTLRNFKAPASQFKKLTAALASIPASLAKASYAGYNFITDAESATASEIAVYGAQPGGSLPGDFDYFVPPPAATPLGSLTLAEAPLIDAENLFRQSGPPL
jgi:hypothetical protein